MFIFLSGQFLLNSFVLSPHVPVLVFESSDAGLVRSVLPGELHDAVIQRRLAFLTRSQSLRFLFHLFNLVLQAALFKLKLLSLFLQFFDHNLVTIVGSNSLNLRVANFLLLS